ncbi:hypothetical protein EJ04DRAFT_560815 [Polyplosphaeria fusca]|uniref:Uncharacterized protein n=1 Tax=Polyplosphaeria fusca TaxID=682080 RepID=A0A9P4V799_9PLEO|nr:hypothetical protein EJ04DRAFT_560815 [Polyplosphaeria fusca]
MVMGVQVKDRDTDDETFSVHRLTQQAFLNDKRGLADPTRSAVQEAFDALVQLIDQKFPRYGRDKSLLEHWSICGRYLPHVSNLALVFTASKKKARSIDTSEMFAELLKNASWYLQEIGELEQSNNLVEVGLDACGSEESLTYAYLCNTKVVLAMDTNKLVDGRKFSEKAIAIREKLLGSDDLDLAISYGNFANILTNEELFDEALANHTLSDNI